MRTARLALLVAIAAAGPAADAMAQPTQPVRGVWQGNATVAREGQPVRETLILTLQDPGECRAGTTGSLCAGTVRFDTIRACSLWLDRGETAADGRVAHGVVFADGGWCTAGGWNGAARVEVAPTAEGGASFRLSVPGRPDWTIETTLARSPRN